VKLFKKPNSKFYWYDFTMRGFRYRGSTQETKSVRALQVASLKLASASPPHRKLFVVQCDPVLRQNAIGT
jgi:hypothetical protein